MNAYLLPLSALLLLGGAAGDRYGHARLLIVGTAIEANRYSAVHAGAALVPLALVLALLSPWMGAVAGKLGPRIPLTSGPLVVAGGFLLALRIDANSHYWTTVFPAVLIIAIGMAGAVAPLTTAVLASVDERHSGAASGLNSAVARTGSMVATALLGGVLGATGQALLAPFHTAAIICALASIVAGAAAFFLIIERQ